MTRETDEEFLEFTRKQPCTVGGCMVPGTRRDPHHLKTRATWGSDYTVIPMCRMHHAQVETEGVSKFESKHHLNLWKEAHAHLLIFAKTHWRDKIV